MVSSLYSNSRAWAQLFFHKCEKYEEESGSAALAPGHVTHFGKNRSKVEVTRAHDAYR